MMRSTNSLLATMNYLFSMKSVNEKQGTNDWPLGSRNTISAKREKSKKLSIKILQPLCLFKFQTSIGAKSLEKRTEKTSMNTKVMQSCFEFFWRFRNRRHKHGQPKFKATSCKQKWRWLCLLLHLTQGTWITEADGTAVQKTHSVNFLLLPYSFPENGREKHSLAEKDWKNHQAGRHQNILLADERQNSDNSEHEAHQ